MAFTYRLEYSSRTKDVSPTTVGKIVATTEQGEAFKREKLTGSVIVTGDDFRFLQEAESFSVQCCQELYFTILRSCRTGIDIFWRGKFTMYDVDMDYDNLEAEISGIQVIDQYNGIFENWHREVNWFGEVDANRRPAVTPLSPHQLVPFFGATSTTDEYNPTRSTLFSRGFRFNGAIQWLVGQTMLGSESEGLADIDSLEFSEFLNAEVNPITGRDNYLRHVILMHISDAKRPGPSSPATKGIVTLKQVLSELKLLYGAYWYISEDGKFHIEHLNFFKNYTYDEPETTLDLTSVQFAETMKGLSQLRYDSEQLKGREGIEQSISLSAYEAESKYYPVTEEGALSPGSPEFTGAYLAYSESCVPKDSKGEASEDYKNVALFTTDWTTVTNKMDVVPDDGWVLAHVVNPTAEQAVEYGWCPISGLRWINGNLSMTRLFFDFGMHDASFAYGLLTYEKQRQKIITPPNVAVERPIRTKSVKNIKTFADIQLSYCCGDEYDFSGFIKHPLDDTAILQSVEYDTITETCIVKLIASNECTDIPYPDYEEVEAPNPACPDQGALLRSEQNSIVHENNATAYITVRTYTDYFADGSCGEYTLTRELRTSTPKRNNGVR